LANEPYTVINHTNYHYMNTFVSVILEIIKISVPALIVFFTVFYLMKQYLASQYQLKSLDFKQNQQSTTIPLRLQAYERLSLFCERIAVPNLILRLREENMSAANLRMAMLIATQQEFEHNITQQVYVSEQLWQIIKIARDDVMTVVNEIYEKMDTNEDASTYAKALFAHLSEREFMPLNQALVAIKKEAGILL